MPCNHDRFAAGKRRRARHSRHAEQEAEVSALQEFASRRHRFPAQPFQEINP